MALSDVDICNRALVLIGGNLITALTDITPEGVICNQFYEEVRDEVIADHPWNFATIRAALVQVNNPGVNWDFTIAYQLPNDCLRVLETNYDDDESPWLVEGRLLWIQESGVQIKYLRQITDPVQFSKGFERALTYKLAQTIAYPIRRDTNTAQAMEQLYQLALKNARAIDGQESSIRKIRTETLTRVR